MTQHLIAFEESIDPAGALANIAGVPDVTVSVSGDDIDVPRELPNIVGQAALTAAANLLSAQIQSPSLRSVVNIDVEPIVNAVVFGDPPATLYHPLSPIPLVGLESLNFLINSDPAVPEAHYGLVWLSDGPQQPVAGNIFTVRATGAAALSIGLFVNTALTFTQTLPVGVYQIVGFRARGTNLVAARLVFIGGIWRPGVPAVNAIGDRDLMIFRYGRGGVLGQFDQQTPPTVDCLGITDTAQTFLLDLIKVG